MYRGKKILITGGTGTIGQHLVRRLLQEEPGVIRIFSRDEFKQFEMAQELQQFAQQLRFLIGDVRDEHRLSRAMADVDYVFHCAAMKHVPACEYNPFEAVQTNIIGTQNVIQSALEAKVKKVIFVSTDKAIAPTNTYGASKLMAERLISSAQYQAGSANTTFAAVRFGNVMGSRGSVIPLFKKQIESKRKITVTHKNMTRFMMTMEEATELTLKAADYAQGGEVFVLKMPVVRLEDLIKAVILEMSKKIGVTPEEIEIEEIGLRPGEKMYEELMTEDEGKRARELTEMFVIPNEFVKKGIYPNSKPVKDGKYSSEDQKILEFDEVTGLLIRSQALV
ncbi:UDP-N-acetylglucosamine 4,6-dehydratase family protein [Paenibacillus macerans]|uniref:UDP-N-acetylglucosamine 4,6-dehydratase family protein n=1 Tax=Paenibacillus macerans TaxID=44252 RepID=UPI00203D3742|nr:UDP-N-acetylglucosamine 4,6-dehydratase family protein [Paenibacillus macerans]MCM3701045.1 polysaccharide biosynthesis protein [Paenibacillus macerans]